MSQTTSQPRQCALCLQPAVLRDSHIIPEFLYKSLYDPKHRFFRKSTDLNKRDLIIQKGMREFLLCQKCETQLSRHEAYFKRAFLDGGIGDSADDGISLHVRGLDYRHVKLLFLSILWRMAISTLDFFRDVDLGPHQERLRTMILNEDPGLPHEYPFITIAPYFGNGRLGNWITQPDPERVGANHVYRIVIAGFLFTFLVPGRDVPAQLAAMFLQADGRWTIRRSKIEDIEFLYKNVIRMGEAMYRKPQ